MSIQEDSINLRQQFRIPVLTDLDLVATVRFDDGTPIRLKLFDVTEVGIKVRFSERKRHQLPVGTSVLFCVQFQGDVVSMVGEVSRSTLDHFVILIEPAKTPEERHQADLWHEMTLEFRRLWLRSRLK